MPSRGSEFENLVLTHTLCLRTALIIHTYQGRPRSTNYINRRTLFLAVAVCRGIKISSSTRFIIKCQVIQFVLKMIDFYWNRSTSCIFLKINKTMYFVLCLQNLCKTFNEIKYVHHYTYWLRIRFSLIGICNMQSNSVNQSVVIKLATTN